MNERFCMVHCSVQAVLQERMEGLRARFPVAALEAGVEGGELASFNLALGELGQVLLHPVDTNPNRVSKEN